MLKKNDIYLNRKFKFTAKIASKCCSYVFQVGDLVEVIEHHSPNRLNVMLVDGEMARFCHRINRSTLNRCAEVINENESEG